MYPSTTQYYGSMPPSIQEASAKAQIRTSEHEVKNYADIQKAEMILAKSLNMKEDIRSQPHMVFWEASDCSLWFSIPQIGRKQLVRKLIGATHFKTEIWKLDQKLQKVKISGHEETYKKDFSFQLSESECNGRAFSKALKKQGIHIGCSQALAQGLLEDALSTLLSHTDAIHYVALARGWNRNSDNSWCFVGQEEEVAGVSNWIGKTEPTKSPFKKEEFQLFFRVLLSYIMNANILDAQGMRLRRPIAVCVENERDIEEMKHYLATFLPAKCADSSLSPKKLRKLLSKANSEPVFYEAGSGRYNQENLDILCRWMSSGNPDNSFIATAIIFFVRVIPDEWMSRTFTISVPDGELCAVQTKYAPKVELKTWSEQATDQAEKFASRLKWESDEDLRVFLLAALLSPPTTGEKLAEQFQDIALAVRHVCQKADDFQVANVPEVFINRFYEWQQERCFISCFERSEAIDETMTSEIILYDTNFLYVPEAIFEEIVSPLQKHLSTLQLKHRLQADDLLVGQTSEGFSVKILCNSLTEKRISRRYMRFRRTKLERIGSLDLVTLIETRREALCC